MHRNQQTIPIFYQLAHLYQSWTFNTWLDFLFNDIKIFILIIRTKYENGLSFYSKQLIGSVRLNIGNFIMNLFDMGINQLGVGYYIMEDYQRRKLYRVHLKNISEIRNCRTPINYTAYSSRLFNFNLKTTFRKRELKSLDNYHPQPKVTCDGKKIEQRRTCDYFREKQNTRLGERLHKALGSIDMNKYQKEYEQHKKIMKLHRKVKQYKRVILYKIYDITFKSISPNLNEQFSVYDMSDDRALSNRKNDSEELLKGNIYQLRNSIIRGFRDEKLILKIVGRNVGVATIINGEKMVPIIHRKEIVGTLILEVS